MVVRTEPKANGQTAAGRSPMPRQFCNLDRLLYSMEQRNIDGIIVSSALNVFYLSGFSGIAHKSDEPRPYALIISRHQPEQAIFIVADYYLNTALMQPSWIEDVRTFRAVMMPFDLPSSESDIDRFVPSQSNRSIEEFRKHHATSLGSACQRALTDLGLDGTTVAADDLRFGQQISSSGTTLVDGYDSLMFARAVKTPHEIEKLRAATRLNEAAINATIGCWQPGLSWREFNRQYQMEVASRGGFVRDPGGMVWGQPRGLDQAITLDSGLDDFAIESGTNIMFDCHGTLDLYCWDGGKTWTVDDEPEGDRKRLTVATANACEAVLSHMKPGIKVSQLQAIGRESFTKSGVPDADSALIFFHGLGLSHMDIEQYRADGSANGDWELEKNMVVPLHILYPGDARHRSWVEEIALVGDDGGEAFFSWGFDPIVGNGQ